MIPCPVLVAWPQPCHTSPEALTVLSAQASSKDFGWTTVWLKQSVRPAVLAPEVVGEGLDEPEAAEERLDDEPQAAIDRVAAISTAMDTTDSVGLRVPKDTDTERLLS